MTRPLIPFNRPSFVGHERRYMDEALALGHVSGDGEFTRRCSQLLREHGILAVFHYLPLHLSEMGGRWGGRAGDCPVTESVSERLVRLPFYTSLSQEDQERVIEAVRSSR